MCTQINQFFFGLSAADLQSKDKCVFGQEITCICKDVIVLNLQVPQDRNIMFPGPGSQNLIKIMTGYLMQKARASRLQGWGEGEERLLF